MQDHNEADALISIIIPCYNEEAALPHFFPALQKSADLLLKDYQVQCEFIFVNDGSKDGTLEFLEWAAAQDSRVRYISFSRNFGKEAAMYAGLRGGEGDYVLIMDADMQHSPSILPEMYEALQSGEYDSVATRRVDRKGEPPVRSFFAKCFYKLINRISDADIVDGAQDFRMMKREMADAVLSMGEYNRFSKGIFGWVGYRTKWLPYQNVERVAGETKWSFWKLFRYSLEGITAFSTAPLAIASLLGIFACFASFLAGMCMVLKTLISGDPVVGWAVLACIIVFMGGLQLSCIGIVGQYLARTYTETKKRPIYLIDKERSYIGETK